MLHSGSDWSARATRRERRHRRPWREWTKCEMLIYVLSYRQLFSMLLYYSVETLREGAVKKVGRSAPLLICVQSQGSPGPSGPRGEKGEQVWYLFSFWKWEMCLYMYRKWIHTLYCLQPGTSRAPRTTRSSGKKTVSQNTV